MPALITHDFFARDVYDRLFTLIGGTRNEADAFLLGSQGPDPLFFTVISPRYSTYSPLGSRMHRESPSKLIQAFKKSLAVLDKNEQAIGRAYVLGFLCHYTLDATIHPFVFAQQYQLCDAGAPNLTRNDGSDVHGVIETELDELVLFAKRKTTITTFNPSKEILRGSDFVLNVISQLYAFCAQEVYNETIPLGLFKAAVKDYRFVQTLLYSPTGAKRVLGGKLERLVKANPRFQSLSHRPLELTESPFANHNRETWVNPFTNEVSAKSFWDLFSQALKDTHKNINLFDQDDFSYETACCITGGLNFSGVPVEGAPPSKETSKHLEKPASFEEGTSC